jgi:zinc transport system ATP-binding protein
MQHVDHTKSIIEVKDLSFTYNREEILKNITLEIHKGDYLGIVGPNGAGKTTLLKCMLGLLKPQKGNIRFFNEEGGPFGQMYRIGYVPQKVSFDPNFPSTAREVVAMGLYGKRGLFKLLTSKDWGDVDNALMEVEMQKFSDRRIGDLSGGQQQRIFIARALVAKPEVVFLDEPTVGVDTETRHQFFSLLETLNKKLSLTLVLITHDMDIILHHGVLEVAYINREILFYGTPHEFVKTKYIDEHYRSVRPKT